jgi:hypothetical protein
MQDIDWFVTYDARKSDAVPTNCNLPLKTDI